MLKFIPINEEFIMSNILKAFINIINSYQTTVNAITGGSNRANNMGKVC